MKWVNSGTYLSERGKTAAKETTHSVDSDIFYVVINLSARCKSYIITFISQSSVKLWRVRPSSDAELFMSRTKFEFGPAQINKSTPVDSDVKLNSPNLIKFEPKLFEKKKRKLKLLLKYVIIIYALGSAHKKLGVSIKAAPKAKFPADPGGKNA